MEITVKNFRGAEEAALTLAPTAPAGESDDSDICERVELPHVLAWADGVRGDMRTEYADRITDEEARVAQAVWAAHTGEQPVSDPDGLPSDWRRVVEGAADMLGESAKQHRGRGDSATAAMCDRFGAMLRDEILSAPAPGEPEFHIDHETLRDALCNCGIAAPLSNEELGMNAASYAKWVVRAVARAFPAAPDEREIAALREDAERYHFLISIFGADDDDLYNAIDGAMPAEVRTGKRQPTKSEMDIALDAARLRAGKEGE